MKQYILLLFALVSIVTGCSREMEQPVTLKKGDVFSWKTRVSRELETKTTIEGTTLSWKAGDQIGLFIGDLQENRPFETSAGSDFEGRLVITEQTRAEVNYYAYYPYVHSVSPSTTVSATLPEEQKAPFDGSANYMIANVVSARYDENDMPDDVTFAFNSQLMSIIKVTITNADETISGQKLMGIELDATGGETLAGAFHFDITNPSAAPVFSTTPSEVSHKVKTSYAENESPTLGTGTEHVIYALVNPTTVSGLKLIIKTTDHVFVATTSKETVLAKGCVVSLPVIDLNGMTKERRIRRVVLWGDSITNTTYRTHVQNLLGNDWEVIRGGISGDSPLGIAGRQGGIPLCLSGEFTIPASNGATVQTSRLYSTRTSGNTPGRRLVGAGYSSDPGGLLNPCTISFKDKEGNDIEVEGTLTLSADHSIFQRSTSGAEIKVPDGATVTTFGAKAYQDADVHVIYMGANSGWDNNEALAAFYKAMKDYTTTKKVIAVGFHMGNRVYFDGGPSYKDYWSVAYVNEMQTVMKESFLDLNTIGRTNALELLIESGAYLNGKTELTDRDQDAVDAGFWPQSWASTNSFYDVHLNSKGSKAMAILVKRKMESLGYLEY